MSDVPTREELENPSGAHGITWWRLRALALLAEVEKLLLATETSR